MTKSRGIRPPRALWSDDDLAWLLTLYPDLSTVIVADALGRRPTQINAMASNLGLHKTPEYLASPDACRLRRGDNIGAAYRFKPGQAVWNKGMKGLYIEGCQATQFKPGQKPGNWMPIGSHRLSKEGYKQRKMTDTGYPPHDWVAVHILLWVEHNGPVPPGHRIAFKDRNKQNIVIENLECVSTAEMMKRNTRHNLPKPLNDLIALRAAVNRQINKRVKNGQNS
jgi:hypothetical protein